MKNKNIYLAIVVQFLIIIGFGFILSRRLTLATSKTSKTEIVESFTSLAGPNNIILADESGNMSSISFPKGMIIIFNGTTVPDGWLLCDGNNGTPNLCGRFVLGSGTSTPGTKFEFGNKGGAETVTLTIAQMPAHTHGGIIQNFGDQSVENGKGEKVMQDVSEQKLNRDLATYSTGGSLPHENMPPYYVLTYIMKK